MLALLLASAFAGLGYRLVDLQVLRHDELAQKARSNTHYTYALAPKRGDILDRNGNLLATSVFVKTVCADPSLIGNHQADVARVIAPMLGLKENDVIQRLTQRTHVNLKGETVPNRYVVLQHKVPVETWQHVQQAMSQLPIAVTNAEVLKKNKAFYKDLRQKAIFTDPMDEQIRNYPNQTLAAHVIGYLGFPPTPTNAPVATNIVGLDGIERTFESKLKGVRGWRETERDHAQRELVAYREEDVEPHDGLNVVLTIDSVIQHILEEQMAEGMKKYSPASINGIVIRPRTGEILAMATMPTFDPNNLSNAPVAARRNHAIADMQEPGSTFKIVVISGALNDRVVTLNDQFDCENGKFWYCGKLLSDHKPYGILTVEQIITKSSNIGAAKVGIKMGEPRLFQYICDYGFGTKSGIELPSESTGIVHTNWNKLSISRVPMGHEVAVTPLQMMMAMCTVANRGVLMKPMIVDRLVDQGGNVVLKNQPKALRQVISPEADRLMIQALKTVVSPDGTAPEAKLDDFTVAGKTGTAQEAGSHGSGYIDGKFYSSFIGFFPADNPEICIYVGMDNPKGAHYGGTVSAPVFKEVAKKVANYLNIRPDKEISPPEPVAQPGAATLIKTAAAIGLAPPGKSGAKD